MNSALCIIIDKQIEE